MALSLKKLSQTLPGSVVCNIVLSYAVFFIARVIFFIANGNYFYDYMSWQLLGEMLQGGLVFDTSAVVYCNMLYIVMTLLPLHYKERPAFHRITKWTYVTLNSVALAANLADTVYFSFTGRRTTATVFSEFGNEGNIATIIFKEMAIHWWLLLIFAIMVWGMAKLYRMPKLKHPMSSPVRYYISQTVALVIAAPLCIFGIRGGIGPTVRPITISNANQYVNRPIESAVVLNTPFSIIRTIGKKPFETPAYMADAEMQRLFSPLHLPSDSLQFKAKNVVVIIIESFGKEYIGSFNRDVSGYEGFAPFTDELISHSLTYTHSYANGRKSIDGMPSVLSGIPMFVEPFFLTPASLNDVSGIAGELNKKGYSTAFFHGAPNGSMGFQAFARATGFKEYYGKMLSLGATTFFEDFDVEAAADACSIDEFPKAGEKDFHRTFGKFCYKGFRHSLCHGWSSGVIPYISETILGMKEIKMNEFKIDAHLSHLKHVKGVYPTTWGAIEVEYTLQSDGTYSASVHAPKEVKIVCVHVQK